MRAAAKAKATAVPAEKTQKNAAKQKPRQAGGLRLVSWQPGSETDASRPLEPGTRLAMESPGPRSPGTSPCGSRPRTA